MNVSPTQSRGRGKGGDFVPFHSPLRSPEAEPLVEFKGQRPFASPLLRLSFRVAVDAAVDAAGAVGQAEDLIE